ncbi:MAG: nuclease-related domain-containing protein [Actinomycetota bacterium]
MALNASTYGVRRTWISALRRDARDERGAAGPLSTPALLETLKSDGYAVIHGISTSRGKLDHVVIGPTGAFAIEARGWSGKIGVNAVPRLTVDGRDEHETVRQVRGAANDVQSRLSRAGVAPWVSAVVVVHEDAQMPRPRFALVHDRVTVVKTSDLIAMIRQHVGALTGPEIARASVAVSA